MASDLDDVPGVVRQGLNRTGTRVEVYIKEQMVTNGRKTYRLRATDLP
ncbi:MAG: hypothetical protein KDI03_18455 [Anaerolineae bacterium]|nr:hypothetical protein [Anaerolineae bacterium]